MAHDNVAQQESRADDTFASPSSEPAVQRRRKDSQGISSKPPRTKQVYDYRLRYATRNGGGGMWCFQDEAENPRLSDGEGQGREREVDDAGGIGRMDRLGRRGRASELAGMRNRRKESSTLPVRTESWKVGKKKKKKENKTGSLEDKTAARRRRVRKAAARLGQGSLSRGETNKVENRQTSPAAAPEEVDGEVQFSPAQVSRAGEGCEASQIRYEYRQWTGQDRTGTVRSLHGGDAKVSAHGRGRFGLGLVWFALLFGGSVLNSSPRSIPL